MTRMRLIALLLCTAPLAASHAFAQAPSPKPASTSTKQAAPASAPTLAGSLKAAGRFSTFLSLQEIAGATQGQRGATQGQRTWLAPNDAAFARLPAGTLERIKSDPKRLDAFLRLHSLPTRLMVSDMFEQVQDSKKSFQSTEGRVLGFQCNGHSGLHQPRVIVFDGATSTAIKSEIRSSGVLKSGATASDDAIQREIRSSGVTASQGTTSAGPGGGPRASDAQGQLAAPAKPTAKGGVQIAVGDVNGDGASASGNTVQGNLIGTDAAAWSEPPQGRIGTFQDVMVAEGVVHELDGVLLARGITD